jgi:hypothetical protein
MCRHGDVKREISETSDRVTVQLPVEWLKEITLVDTPGSHTNALHATLHAD